MAVQPLIRVEILSSACVNSLEIEEMRFILFVPCEIVITLRRCQNYRDL